MRGVAALAGSLLLVLLLAAPAAANHKVHIAEMSGPYEWEMPVTAFGWACSEPVYVGGYGTSDLWLWYAQSVDITDPDEYMPDGRAWPWIEGLTKDRGTFYARTGPVGGGKMISASYGATTRVYDHHLGGVYPFDVPYPPGVDLETWRARTSGLTMSVHAPGGMIYHEAGHGTGTSTVIEQNRAPEFDEIAFEPDPDAWQGISRWDDPKLCRALGLEYAGPTGG